MVSFADFNKRGAHNWINRELRRARSAASAIEHMWSRPLLIPFITPSGQFIGDAEESLRRILAGLKNSHRVYQQGNTIIFLQGSGNYESTCSPTPIAVDGAVTKVAPAIVRNVMMCRELKANSNGKGAKPNQPLDYEVQYAVPQAVLQQVVVMDGFRAAIPKVQYIVNHPVFDESFRWLEPGYHEEQEILVCGEQLEPAELGPAVRCDTVPQTVADVLAILPPLIHRWVDGSHWKSPVDLINYIGAALMIPLMPMLVSDGHPGVMFWGNQPGVGKSVAAQCLAILKDGEQASPTAIDGGSREVENQIASELNDGRTVLFIDNQKGTLNIPILEANMTSKNLAIRGFNIQKKVRRPNDLLWLITTNDALPSDDLLARCIHIRLYYEGHPDAHHFAMTDAELMNFVRANRAGILAELAGMVVRWLDAGRPSAPSDYRFKVCGHVIGSVLAANGLHGFLSNTREEVREHSAKHQQLVALAERLIDSRDRAFVWEIDCDIDKADEEFKRRAPPENPMEQKDWVHILTGARVIPESCDTHQKQKAAATQYFNDIVKKPVEVDVGDRTVRAMLVSRPLRSRRTAYMLAVEGLPTAPEAPAGDGDGDAGAASPSGTASSAAEPADGGGAAVMPAAPDDATSVDGRQGDDLWGT